MGSRSGRSYITGWGKNAPARPHHKAASCAFVTDPTTNCSVITFSEAETFPNVLPGGLVSGPDRVDAFVDDQNEYLYTEVANDYNAALVSGMPPAPSCSLPPAPSCCDLSLH